MIDITGKQLPVLQHNAQLGTDRGGVDVRQVLTVVIDRAAQRLFKAKQQPDQCGLAAAGFPHDGHMFSRRNAEADILQHFPLACFIGKPQVAHFKGARQHLRIGLFLGTFRFGIQYGLDVFQQRPDDRNRFQGRDHRVQRGVKRRVRSLERDKGGGCEG